jgi:anti-anti-sigma regulatory factor
MDPVLEVWIEDHTSPVRICLAGLLDSSTSASLLSLTEQLICEGAKDFVVDAGALEIGDAPGANALTIFQRRARHEGGSLSWEGLDFVHRDRLTWGDAAHSL